MQDRHGDEVEVELFTSENTNGIVVAPIGAGMSFVNMQHIKQSIESGRNVVVVDGKSALTSHKTTISKTKDGMKCLKETTKYQGVIDAKKQPKKYQKFYEI